MRTIRPVSDLTLAERINFLLTNRLPRQAATRFIGRFSRIRNPLVSRLSIGVWKLFVDDLRLEEAKKQRFASLHDCFTRELKPGARAVDAREDVLASPCDAVVGEFGSVAGLEVLQAKGFPYTLPDLLGDADNAERYRNGRFVTLRLKSSMYHRFHAPCAGRVRRIRYVSGDTWNVNPIALKVIERLFCKNERAIIDIEPAGSGGPITLVPIAAILVASMRIHGIAATLDSDYSGAEVIPCDLIYARGEEMGYFQHGSTIVVFTTSQYQFIDSVVTGQIIRMGQPLLIRNNSANSE